MEVIGVKQLGFYGDEDLELVISRNNNNNINLEITETNGFGVAGVVLASDQVKQLIDQLNKLIKEG